MDRVVIKWVMKLGEGEHVFVDDGSSPKGRISLKIFDGFGYGSLGPSLDKVGVVDLSILCAFVQGVFS